MHYGDYAQHQAEELRLIVYKHGIVGEAPSYKRDGALARQSVDYQITAIVICTYFNPNSLAWIINNPYRVLNSKLSGLPFEAFYEFKIRSLDGYRAFEISEIYDVSNDLNELKQLH